MSIPITNVRTFAAALRGQFLALNNRAFEEQRGIVNLVRSLFGRRVNHDAYITAARQLQAACDSLAGVRHDPEVRATKADERRLVEAAADYAARARAALHAFCKYQQASIGVRDRDGTTKATLDGSWSAYVELVRGAEAAWGEVDAAERGRTKGPAG